MSCLQRRRLGMGLLWGCVAVGTTILARKRYFGATAQIGLDFERFYHPAAVALATGGNPYDVPGYVYSPAVAALVAPLTRLDLEVANRLLSAGMVLLLAASASSTFWWPAEGWRRPVLVGAALLTTLHFWPTTICLWEGNANPLVLLSLSAAATASLHGRGTRAALLLATGGLFKTWPLAFGLGLCARPIRRQALVAWLSAAFAGPALAFALGGWRWVAEMLTAPTSLGEQGLVSHSIVGFSNLMFDRTGQARPVADSRFLEVGTIVVLVVVLVVSIARLYRSAAGHSAAIPHTAGVVVLLLPVSHLAYAIFVLPLLWWWVLRALCRPTPLNVAGLVLTGSWWTVVSQPWPDTNASADLSALAYSVVFGCTYLAILGSCWLSAAGAEAPGAGSAGRPRQPQPS